MDLYKILVVVNSSFRWLDLFINGGGIGLSCDSSSLSMESCSVQPNNGDSTLNKIVNLYI